MSAEYPHPCNRCGFCCLAQPCPAELAVHGPRPPGGRCPELSFDGDVATCGMIAKLGELKIGIGVGCCIKAKAVYGRTVLDFASMPDELKILATRGARTGETLMIDQKDN